MATEPAPNRLTIALLTAMTVLLAMLVIGLGVGGFFAMRHAPEILGMVREMRQELVATRKSTQKLSAEADRTQALAREASAQAARRQQILKQELLSRSRRTQAQMDGIARRRARIPERASPNPLAKLDVVIELNTLMADELVILNRHFAETQAYLAEALGPLPLQE